jgi:hypothetical protein
MTPVLTLAAAAAALGLSTRHLRDLIAEGQIAAWDAASPGAARPAIRIEQREVDAFKLRRRLPCRTADGAAETTEPARAMGRGVSTGRRRKAASPGTSGFAVIDFEAVCRARAARRPRVTSPG